jgi:hypothetical protein
MPNGLRKLTRTTSGNVLLEPRGLRRSRWRKILQNGRRGVDDREKRIQGLLTGPAILGVDPGLSGAVARLGGGKLEIKRDFKSPADIAAAVRDLAPGTSQAVIEDVHAMPGQGVCSMFSFGNSTGWAQSALFLCHQGETVLVSPMKWQYYFRQLFGITKGTEFNSRELATMLFPSYSSLFARKKDHNSADAVLLASWLGLERSGQ